MNSWRKYTLFFVNDLSNLSESTYIIDPINRAIAKYKNHPSVILMKEGIKIDQQFDFNLIEGKLSGLK